jgi:hypothetical protein
VSALAFGRLGGRPVLASGALDGTVRVWDMNDTATAITISTRAAVGDIALAEPTCASLERPRAFSRSG